MVDASGFPWTPTPEGGNPDGLIFKSNFLEMAVCKIDFLNHSMSRARIYAALLLLVSLPVRSRRTFFHRLNTEFLWNF